MLSYVSLVCGLLCNILRYTVPSMSLTMSTQTCTYYVTKHYSSPYKGRALSHVNARAIEHEKVGDNDVAKLLEPWRQPSKNTSGNNTPRKCHCSFELPRYLCRLFLHTYSSKCNIGLRVQVMMGHLSGSLLVTVALVTLIAIICLNRRVSSL